MTNLSLMADIGILITVVSLLVGNYTQGCRIKKLEQLISERINP